MLREWCPAFTDWAVHSLADAHGPACLRTASAVHGKAGRTCLTGSSWRRIGEWRHGWQHCDVLGTFSSATTCCCLRTPLLGFRPSPAHTSLIDTIRIALRRILRLPLPPFALAGACGSASEPGCGHCVDAFGDHTLTPVPPGWQPG